MGKLSQALAPAGRPPNNADIVLRLAQSIHQLPISTKIAWVRSHQDRNPRNTWTKGAKLNILANELADAYLSNNPQGTLGHPESNSSHFPTMQASLLLGTTRIYSATSSWMRISIQNYREFFIQTHRIRFHQTISTILIGRSFLRHSGSRKEREKLCYPNLSMAGFPKKGPGGENTILAQKCLYIHNGLVWGTRDYFFKLKTYKMNNR